MYAVIFRATIENMDEEYIRTSEQLRQAAFDHFGCVDFHSTKQDKQLIAVSYWRSLGDIQAWNRSIGHQIAQQNGIWKWYESCHVDVVEVLRQY